MNTINFTDLSSIALCILKLQNIHFLSAHAIFIQDEPVSINKRVGIMRMYSLTTKAFNEKLITLNWKTPTN